MRTRRRFQPMLDEMPTRIAPSAVLVADTDMPETGTSVPVITVPDLTGPGPTTPPVTLLC
jgi:hypothetical protein